MGATLEIERRPTDDDRVVMIACAHGATALMLRDLPGSGLTEHHLVVMVVLQHECAEGCGCAWPLAGGMTG